MKKILICLGVIIVALVISGPAIADLINSNRPITLGASWDPYNPPTSGNLYNFFDGLLGYPAAQGLGDSGIDAYNDQQKWAIFVPGSDLLADSTIFLEVSGYATANTIGIYEYGNPSNKLLAISGPKTQGYNVNIDFDANANGIWGDVVIYDLGGTISSGTFSTMNFGLYLITGGGNTFYTEDSLNGGNPQALVYNGSPLWGDTGDIYIAWEDLVFDPQYGGQISDNDFNDIVIHVSDVDHAVPEPATMLLLGSGLIGLAGFARRRFKK